MPATVQNNNIPAQASPAAAIAPNAVSAYNNSLSPTASMPLTLGAPALDFGPASTLAGGGSFMPPSVFDANSMGSGGFMPPSVFDTSNAGSILGVPINNIIATDNALARSLAMINNPNMAGMGGMLGTAGMPTSFLNAPPTALDMALANSINAAFAGARMSPPMGQPAVPTQQPGTVNPGPSIAEYGRTMSGIASATQQPLLMQQPGMINPNRVGPVSIAEYGRVMSQIAGYQQATAQLGIDTALYSAQIAGQTAGIQAMGQQAMMYMNAIA